MLPISQQNPPRPPAPQTGGGAEPWDGDGRGLQAQLLGSSLLGPFQAWLGRRES